jgi:hypothetical protein
MTLQARGAPDVRVPRTKRRSLRDGGDRKVTKIRSTHTGYAYISGMSLERSRLA